MGAHRSISTASSTGRPPPTMLSFTPSSLPSSSMYSLLRRGQGNGRVLK